MPFINYVKKAKMQRENIMFENYSLNEIILNSFIDDFINN